MAVHVFGIRHHGPGSARSLLTALDRLQPDALLVEGPVEADDQIAWIGQAGFRPPVALLVYRPDEPRSAVFYPFAEFSPEWNALRYAVTHGVPVSFMDLPKSHWMALKPENEPTPDSGEPLQTLARVAGEADFERWWDRLVESRGEAEVFPAIQEAMTALRTESAPPAGEIDLLREAAMRQQIRKAEKAGHERIAVVCGAWHVPALTNPRPAKEDTARLKGLPKVKVQATWVPWTHGRLMIASGYGAGIESPGWYEHVWSTPAQTSARWVSKVAALLRGEDLDASPAQVVDTIRLAETLASFRGKRRPGLPELNDATETVLLFGNATPLRLIHDRLIVGEVLGAVPPEATAAPIQKGLEAQQKRLRLKPEASSRQLDLDLRNETDRERSKLLHRLHLIGVPWGTPGRATGKLGTFHELWTLRWDPEFAVELITAARWGNTVETAAEALTRNAAQSARSLPELTALLEPALKADLGGAAAELVRRVREIGAVAPDIADLMETIPPFARVARYGDVRATDRQMVRDAIAELLARVCVSLPVACGSLDDAAARAMTDRISGTDQAIGVFEEAGMIEPWREALQRVIALPSVHGLVGGRSARLLFEAGVLADGDLAARASQALSPGVDPAAGAAWIEGVFENSGSVLLVHRKLWAVLDAFVQDLPGETFRQTLPLLRRTFSTFAPAERRQLGERAREDAGDGPGAAAPVGIDEQRAALALPLLRTILGLEAGDAD